MSAEHSSAHDAFLTAERNVALIPHHPALTRAARGHNFLTADEAAVYLGGLNSRTVTRWARENYIPAYPIGEGKRRLWRFLQDDLEAWMLARRRVTNVY